MGLQLLPLTYRRPSHARTNSSRGSEKGDVSINSGRCGASAGIPPALSFDKIMAGGTCPVSLTSAYQCPVMPPRC